MVASILRPFSSIAFPGKQTQPQGTDLTIDSTNRLTLGLIGCWVPGVMGGVDLTGNAPTLAGGINTQWSATPEGSSLLCNNSSGSDGFNGLATAPFESLSGMSLYWRGVITAQVTNASNPSIFGLLFGNGASSPFTVFVIAPGSNSQYPTITIYYNNGASISVFNTLNIVNNFNVMYSFGATFKTSGNVIFYNNGINAGSTSAPASIGFNGAGSDTLIVGDDLSARTSNSSTNIAMFWNRELSADEMMAVHLDPYGFIIPPEYDLPAVFSPPVITFNLMPQIVT